jgi:YesN/AraC family two-component response regulator
MRCKMIVERELAKLGLHITKVELGQADIIETISIAQLDQIRSDLLKSGLEFINEPKSVLVEKIKKVIVQLVHYAEEPLSINLSGYLAQQLNYNYTYLANIFSETQGSSIEKFFIQHKIERVKELITYNELNLTEIAYKMHYSSVAHLSSQFKKVTGDTPSNYKKQKVKTRSMLEEL